MKEVVMLGGVYLRGCAADSTPAIADAATVRGHGATIRG
jgi:hypothetical protein